MVVNVRWAEFSKRLKMRSIFYSEFMVTHDRGQEKAFKVKNWVDKVLSCNNLDIITT
jgi:hypothetical protein